MLSEPFFIFFTSFALGISLYPVFIRLYTKNSILDKRDHRKVHLEDVPTMGGVPIFIAFLVSIFIWLSYAELQLQRYLIGVLLFVLFIGLRDDFVNLKPTVKLLSQVVPAFLFIYFTDIRITSLYGFISESAFPQLISYLLTITTIIVITNSINLIDGLDGLAGTVSTIILLSFGSWFFLSGEHAIGLVLFAMAGSVVAFLQFNWQPAKIFMGDTGALLIGFLIAIATVAFINMNYRLAEDDVYKLNSSISVAVAILFIPFFDTLRVFFLRLIKKKSPFIADKNHLHHNLLLLGFSHAKISLVLGGVNILVIGLTIVFSGLGDNILLPSLIITGILTSIILERKFTKARISKGDFNAINVTRSA